MPANAAARTVINLATNWSGTAHLEDRNRREFFFSNGRKGIASGEIRNTADFDNPSSSVDLVVQLQNSQFALDNTITFGADSTAGNLILTVNGVDTGNISGSGGMTAAKILAALVAMPSLSKFDIEVQTATAGTVFQIIFRHKSSTTTPGYKGNVQRPVEFAIVVKQLATTQATGTVADNTWKNVHPDGYNAALTVKPGGKLPFSYGSASSASNLLGPNFRILVTGGVGQMEIAPSDETTNIVRV